MHIKFKIHIFRAKAGRFANLTNKRVRYYGFLYEICRREISTYFNIQGLLICTMYTCNTYHKDIFSQFLFYVPPTFTDDVSKFLDLTLHSLVAWCDSVLKEIFPRTGRKYFSKEVETFNSLRNY